MGADEKPMEVGPDNITVTQTTSWNIPSEYQTLLINGEPVLVDMYNGPHELSQIRMADGEIKKILNFLKIFFKKIFMMVKKFLMVCNERIKNQLGFR